MNNLLKLNRVYIHRFGNCSFASSANEHLNVLEEEPNFPVLNILPYSKVKREQRTVVKTETISPRYKRLSTNQRWGDVWPAARNFHPGTVPLPIHMSYVDDNKPRPAISKFNNPELLKIPNFLHLTPPVIKKQCEVLRRFCTKWPEALKSDEDCDRYFPVSVVTKDFVFSGPSIRWPDARVVELILPLKRLELDEHGMDKMKRLLRHRYNDQTGLITIQATSCPLRKQNYDYAQYLLTAVYFESWKTEQWESEKEYSDWERYFWEKSRSKQSMVEYLQRASPTKFSNEQNILNNDQVKKYAQAVSELYDKQESKQTLQNYKESVLQLLF